MGVFCKYSLTLKIKSMKFDEALQLLNELHSDEMLLKHARGGIHGADENRPVKEKKWYSWVSNPDHPYRSLEEAFDNWNLVEEDVTMKFDEDGNFVLSGKYDNKIGQQSFFLQHMARVIEDMIVIVELDSYKMYTWSIKNHVFTEEKTNFK